MSRRRWILLFVVLIVGALAIGPGRQALSLWRYAQQFEPERLNEQFRTVHLRDPSLTLPASRRPLTLPEARAGLEALPERYALDGVEHSLAEMLERTDMTGMIVLHEDEVVFETYGPGYGRDTPALQMSVTKTMIAHLAGVALARGELRSIDDPVTDYVPALVGTAYEDVTVGHLLQMSSGIRWVEDVGDWSSELIRSVIASRLGSLDRFAASMVRDREPGTFHRYASIDTHVLGMVVRGATGVPIADYFHEHLWEPLGATGPAHFLLDATGEPMVQGGLLVTLRDMARFGRVYLDGGVNLAGERLLSADWVRFVSVPDLPMLQPGEDNPLSDTTFGYGRHWWIPLEPEGDYAALGIYGQFIYVHPERRVVIARTSAYRGYTEDGGAMLHENLVAFRAIAHHLSRGSERDLLAEGR